VLVIHHGTFPLPGTPESESLSEEERKGVLADYNALNAMGNVTPAPRWVCRRTRRLSA
jgi:hypothetical protein